MVIMPLRLYRSKPTPTAANVATIKSDSETALMQFTTILGDVYAISMLLDKMCQLVRNLKLMVLEL